MKLGKMLNGPWNLRAYWYYAYREFRKLERLAKAKTNAWSAINLAACEGTTWDMGGQVFEGLMSVSEKGRAHSWDSSRPATPRALVCGCRGLP